MENNHLNYFKIENFKKFDSLELNDLGRFNLIVGENNVGKTSLLESLCFEDSLPDLLENYSVFFSWRKIKNVSTIDFDYISLLKNNKELKDIIYTYKNNNSNNEKVIKVESKSIAELDQRELAQLRSRLTVKNSTSKYVGILDFENKKSINYLQGFTEFTTKGNYIPFIPFHSSGYEDLMEFYSGNFQNSKSARKELIKSLEYFIPDIEDIEISTGIIPTQNNLIIWRKGFDSPFLINFFGEGTNKILRVLLEIKTCSGSKIMIDEIDCGIHYSKMNDFFKIIINAANLQNVQLFATTHSKECIEKFIITLEKTGMQEEGRIIRLAETKNGIKAFTMRFAEFENALMAESEIR